MKKPIFRTHHKELKKMKKNHKSIINIIFLLLIYSHNFLNGQTLSGGGSHTLYRCSNGVVNGVGHNVNGQLGNGVEQYNSYSIVLASGLSNIIDISAGEDHSLFLKNDGTVWSTGRNDYGQLGDGTFTNKNIPIQILGLTNISAISAGTDHSLFLKNDGTVWGVGRGGFGQLGNGTLVNVNIPVQILGLTGINAISAGGFHSLFLKNDSTVWATGRNNFGQLGNGTTLQYNSNPFQIPNISDIIALDAGGGFSIFLKNNGTVWATGENGYGQLGDGTMNNMRTTPIQVLGLSGVTFLKAGTHHSLFLRNDGTVWAVGFNTAGTLGDGTNVHKSIPIQVLNISGVNEISAGGFHSLFLKNDGTVWAVGSAAFGQLGDGTNVSKNSPIQITGFCDSSLGVNENFNNDSNISYPNPVKDILYFKMKHKISKIEVYEITGRILSSNTVSENKIDLNELKTGNYILKLYTEKGIMNTKIIKE